MICFDKFPLDYRINLKAELEIEELLHRVGKIEGILVEHTNEDA
jgi:uncharacterized membrane protein